MCLHTRKDAPVSTISTAVRGASVSGTRVANGKPAHEQTLHVTKNANFKNERKSLFDMPIIQVSLVF